MAVTIYGKESCIACDRTQKLFDKHNIEYDVVDVEKTEGAIDYIKSLGYSALPVVFYNDEHWSGFRVDKIRAVQKEMEAAKNAQNATVVA